MEKIIQGNRNYVIILLIGSVLMIASASNVIPLSATGYPSAYEGAKAEFYGAHYRGLEFTNDIRPESQTEDPPIITDDAVHRFLGTSMNFDPDYDLKLMPNIKGEMTTIFIPEQSNFVSFGEWVPREWTNELGLIANPYRVFTWSKESPSLDPAAEVERHDYRMEEWLTKWYISFEAKPDSEEPFKALPSEADDQRFTDTEIWFEIDISQNWYFEGQTSAHFAIAKISLSHVIFEGKDINRIDVTPESPGSALYISYNPFGVDEFLDATDTFEGYYQDNVLLNPQFFRPKIYTHIRLDDFGSQSWWDLRGFHNQADVVTFEFTVKQFVIGEWVVKDIEPDFDEDNPYLGRRSRIGSRTIYIPILSDIGAFIIDFFASPLNIAGLGLFLILLVAAASFMIFVYYRGIPGWIERNE